MQARRYASENTGAVSRSTADDEPEADTNDEVLDLRDQPPARKARPNRPLVATRSNPKESTEEILSEIEERATASYSRRRRRLTSRR
jgi:hypothetical protein